MAARGRPNEHGAVAHGHHQGLAGELVGGGGVGAGEERPQQGSVDGFGPVKHGREEGVVRCGGRRGVGRGLGGSHGAECGGGVCGGRGVDRAAADTSAERKVDWTTGRAEGAETGDVGGPAFPLSLPARRRLGGVRRAPFRGEGEGSEGGPEVRDGGVVRHGRAEAVAPPPLIGGGGIVPFLSLWYGLGRRGRAAVVTPLDARAPRRPPASDASGGFFRRRDGPHRQRRVDRLQRALSGGGGGGTVGADQGAHGGTVSKIKSLI